MKKLSAIIFSDSHLGARLGLSFVLLIAILVSVGWVGIRQLRRVDQDFGKMVDQRWQKVQLSRKAQALSNINSRLTMQVFLVDEPEIKALMAERAGNSEKISQLIETLRSKVDSREEEELLNAIDEKRNPYTESYKSALQVLVDDKIPDVARAMMVKQALPRLIEYHDAWNAYVDYQGHQMDRAKEGNAVTGAATRRTTVLLTAFAVLFAFTIAIFVTRNTTWHINRRRHADAALRQAHDELEEKVRGRTAELANANAALGAEISERKQAEAGLRESEERYRDLFENANDIIYTHDLQGNYTSVNKACEKITGYASDESLGMNMSQIVAPKYLEMVKQMIAFKSANHAPSAYELGIIAKDGHRVMLEVNSRLTYQDGKPIGVQGIARDITERKRAELERQVISEIGMGIITTSNLDELLNLIHTSISKLLYAENCFVALHDPATDMLHFEFWKDKFDAVLAPRPVGTGFSSHILRTGQPLLLTQELKKRLYEEAAVLSVGTDSASWLGVPLRTPLGVIGVLAVQHYENEDAYDERDLEFLSSVRDSVCWAFSPKAGRR